MIDCQESGSTMVVRIDHGKVNALDVDVLRAFVGCLRDVEESGSTAVVVSGNGRVFSAGVDLVRVLEGDPPYTGELLNALSEAFETLFTYPLPVVSAIDGAAIAGGCVLACAADRRLMGASAGPIGVSELVVGVPFPAAAIEIVRHACGARAEEAVLGGALYTAEEAKAVGMVHEVVPDGELHDRALAVAGALGGIPSRAYRLTKSQLRQQAHECMREGSRTRDRRVAELWSDPETRAAIRAHLERVTSRKT